MSFSLGSDNHSGVHPVILDALARANVGHAHSYGLDEVSEKTKTEWIRVLGTEAEIFYVFNGTAANVLSLQAFVKPYEAVVASEQSHLVEDECGAPEKHLGCKLWTLPSANGKIYPAQMRPLLERGGDQHYASPRIISLTLPTELGVCYRVEELKAWRLFADQRGLFIHWDGARLVNAAAFLETPISDLIKIGRPDVISFGGTKNGLVGAEAIVIFDSQRAKDFKYIRKQGMQLSSKTRFLAAQFHAFFKDDLYKDIARHVTDEARFLADAIKEFPELMVEFPVESNAVFVSMPKSWAQALREKTFFYLWPNQKTLGRWMISFDWTRAQTEVFLNQIREVKKQWPI